MLNIRTYKLVCSVTLILFLFLLPKNTLAKELLLQDDFDDGNSSGWSEINPWGSWSVQNKEYIGQAQLLQSPALPSLSTIGQESWDDYELNVKLRGQLGIDKQILFRVNTAQNRAYILNIRSQYFNGGNDILLAKRSPLGTENATLLTAQPFVSSPNVVYDVKIQVGNTLGSTNIIVYVDNDQKINYTDNLNPILNGKIGLEIVPGGYLPGNPIGLITKTAYDNISVYSLDKQISLKQYDPLWKDVIYDSADVWSPGKSTIERYGCALTSATMILQYYGHIITPDSLNTWLLQNDGYVGNGMINWSSITRWAKKSNESNPSSNKLEYKRYSFTTSRLDEEIDAGRPSIVKLKQPDTGLTHFVVVNDKLQTGYKMSDPATINDNLSFYPTERYSQINTFVQSNTDLSYLYTYIENTHDIKIFTSSGVELNNTNEEGIIEDQIDHNTAAVNQLKSFEYPKPEFGKYLVKIFGNGPYTLETRYYDMDGILAKFIGFGSLVDNKSDSYIITIESEFNKIDKIDFTFIKNLLKTEFALGNIKKKSVYQTLINTLLSAEKASSKNLNTVTKLFLDMFILEVKVSSKYIENETAVTLLQYIKLVKASL